MIIGHLQYQMVKRPYRIAQMLDLQTERIFEICLMKLHIGQEIKKIYEQSGLKLKEFASRMSYDRRNIYTIFEREEVTTDVLKKASMVLKFNFFELYERELTFLSEPKVQYKALSKENQLLKEELNLTKQLMDTKDELLKEYRKIPKKKNGSADSVE